MDGKILNIISLIQGFYTNISVAAISFQDVVTQARMTIGDESSERLANGILPLRRQINEALNLIKQLEK